MHTIVTGNDDQQGSIVVDGIIIIIAAGVPGVLILLVVVISLATIINFVRIKRKPREHYNIRNRGMLY